MYYIFQVKSSINLSSKNISGCFLQNHCASQFFFSRHLFLSLIFWCEKMYRESMSRCNVFIVHIVCVCVCGSKCLQLLRQPTVRYEKWITKRCMISTLAWVSFESPLETTKSKQQIRTLYWIKMRFFIISSRLFFHQISSYMFQLSVFFSFAWFAFSSIRSTLNVCIVFRCIIIHSHFASVSLVSFWSAICFSFDHHAGVWVYDVKWTNRKKQQQQQHPTKNSEKPSAKIETDTSVIRNNHLKRKKIGRFQQPIKLSKINAKSYNWRFIGKLICLKTILAFVIVCVHNTFFFLCCCGYSRWLFIWMLNWPLLKGFSFSNS